jgi:hypothetical protein
MVQPNKENGAPRNERAAKKSTSTKGKYANGAKKSSDGVKRANGKTRDGEGLFGAVPTGRDSVLYKTWRKLCERGYSPVPLHPAGVTIRGKDRAKTPILHCWNDMCERLITPAEINAALELQPRAEVGVACEFDNLIVIDGDTEDPAIKAVIEQTMVTLFPDAPRRLGKRTRPGAWLFHWADEGPPPSVKFVGDDDEVIFELLGRDKQLVMPPSVHKSGVVYEFANGETLPPPFADLPNLKKKHVEFLVETIRAAGFKITAKTSSVDRDAPTPEELDAYLGVIDGEKAIKATVDYLKTRAPISVQNKRGHDNAVHVFHRCLDIGCKPEQAVALMWRYWNQRNRPPWSTFESLDAELAGLINSRKKPIGVDNADRLFAQYGEEAVKNDAENEEAAGAQENTSGDAKEGGAKEGASDRGTSAKLFDPWERFIVPDFPLDILPPDLARFVETHSRIIGCDASALAMCVMSALSAALDHRFALKMMRNGDFYASPRLWILLFGPPSTKKTPMQNVALAPLKAHENRIRDAYERALSAHKDAEGKPKDEPPLPPRFISNDMTTEKLGELLARHDRGMLVARDELAGWIGSMEKYGAGRGGASDRGFWLQSYDGGVYIVDRIKRGEIRVPNLSVSILGGIQPNRLAELHGLTSDGLLQRFIPVVMREAKFPEDIDDDGSKAAYTRLIEKCLSAEPTKLHMSDAAMEAMTRLRKHIHDVALASGGFADGFQTFVGKLAGVAGSFALILHMIKGDPRTQALAPIDVETIEHVDRLIRDFILPHAFEFYRTSETQTNGDRLQKIASWILTSGKNRIVSSDLTSGVRIMRGLTLQQVNEWLSPLIAGAWLTTDPDDTHRPMGLNKSWLVNPSVKSLFAERAAEEERRKQAIAELMNSDRRGRRQRGESDNSDTTK